MHVHNPALTFGSFRQRIRPKRSTTKKPADPLDRLSQPATCVRTRVFEGLDASAKPEGPESWEGRNQKMMRWFYRICLAKAQGRPGTLGWQLVMNHQLMGEDAEDGEAFT